MPKTDLKKYSYEQLRALELRYLPLSEWTYEELAQQERALRSATTLGAIGQGARDLARAVANQPIVGELARFIPSRETVATGLDTLPGPAAGAATFLSGYGMPATPAMTAVAAAAGRDAANRLRGTYNGVAEPLAYGVTQGLAVGTPALGRVTSLPFAANAPRVAAAAELGAQMGVAGATGTGLTVAYQGASGQELDWKEALKVGGVTALLGGIGGGLRAHEVTKLAAADRDGLIMQARKLGFKGKGFDEMRAWYREMEDAADILQKGRQQNARPVGPNAPAEEGAMVPRGQIQPLADAPPPPPPPNAPAIVPRAPVPIAPAAQSLQTQPAAPMKPLAQMTDAELEAAAQALIAPPARPLPAAPGGDLFGDMPFNLASEQQRAPVAPVAPTQAPAEMFGAEIRTTAPTALDRANEAARAQAPAVVPVPQAPAAAPETPAAIIDRLTSDLGMADLGREYDRPPELVQKLQQLGEALLPGVRIQEGERLAQLHLLAIRGEVPARDVQKYKQDLIKGNYVRQAPTPAASALPPGPVAVPAPAARPIEVAGEQGLKPTAPRAPGAITPTPAAPEVHTVYDVRGRSLELPADQPPPSDMVTADQWAELAPLKQTNPERFRTRWLRTLNENGRLARAAARSAKAPISGRVSNQWKRPFAAHPIRGTTDIIDHIMDAGGIPRPGKDTRGGEFDGWKDAFQGAARRLIAPGKAGGWDTWTQDIASRSGRPELAGVNAETIAREIDLALADRNRGKAAGRIEDQEGQFYQAAMGQARGSRPGREILAQELPKGATLKLDRETFTVAKVDAETGNVTLRDGPKYGTQIMRPDASLYPDKGTLRGPDGKALKVAKVKPAAPVAPSGEDENPFDPGAGGSVAGDPVGKAPEPSRGVGFGGARAVLEELRKMAVDSVPAYNREPGGRLILDGNATPFMRAMDVFKKTLSIRDAVDFVGKTFPSIDKGAMAERLQAALDGAQDVGGFTVLPFNAKMFRGETGRKAGETIGESWTAKKEVAASYGPVSEKEISLGDVLKADEVYSPIELIIRGSDAGTVVKGDDGEITGRDIIEHVTSWLRDTHGVTSPIAVSNYLKKLGWEGYAMSDQLFVFDPAKLKRAKPGAGEDLADPMNPEMPAPPPGTTMGAHADARMPVAMDRIMPGQVDVPTVMAALENVIAVVGGRAPIRSGRFGQKARGVFKTYQDVIRLDRIDNIPTAAHEVAHAISLRIFGGVKSSQLMASMRGSTQARQAIAELRVLGRALYGARKPVAGYTAEGFSELLRLWLTTEDAAKRAPAATKWLETELLANQGALAVALRDARELIDLWRGQGAQGRARAQMKEAPGRLRTMRDAARRILSREAQVEEFTPLKKLRDGYRATTGNRLSPSADPYELASSVRMTAGPVLETMVERGMVDLWGNIVGPGLKESLALVKPGQAEDFKHYLWARRAIERWGKGKNPGMALEDAKFLRNALETPEFVTSAAKYYEWWDGVLNYLESAAPATNGPLVRAIRNGSKDYVPLARELDPARVRSQAAGAGGNSLKRMMGSGLPVKELYLQSLLSAEKLIAQAHRDLVLDSIINLAQAPGMGWLVEEVPVTRVMEQINVEHIRRELEGLGVDTSAVAEDTLLQYASHLDTPRGVDPIIRRMVGGQARWFQIPADLFDLLQGIEQPQRLGLVFELFLGGPNRLFKLGVTGLNPSFAMVTNPVRDFPTFMLQSIAGNPGTRVLTYGQSLAAIVRSALGGKESPELALFKQLGITASNYLGGDIQQAKRAAKGLFHGKLWRMIRTPLETTREAFSFTESAPRLAEMSLLAQELGWRPGQKLTPDQAVALRNAAARVTTDFRAAGALGRQVNRALPFYNAAIQGMRSAARAFKSDQGTKQIPYRWLKTLLTGASMLTLPALYNWWNNKDEEWYRMLPWRERWLYLNVEKDGTVFQVPLAPDWGSAFITLPVAALDAWYQKDPETLKQAFRHIFTVSNPLSMPVLVGAGWEQASNHVQFFDRPIIPRGEIDLMPGAQRSQYSSWLAKTLGDVFPEQVSPRRVDAALRQVFGGVAGSIADAPTAFQRALGLKTDETIVRESEAADIPVLGRLFRHGGTYTANNQALIDYWDDLNRYGAWKSSNLRAMKEGKTPLQPMTFRDQVYARRLEAWQPVIQISLQVAARTPELEKRQALYKRAAEQARRVIEARPPAP